MSQNSGHVTPKKTQVKIEFNANEITEKRKVLVEVEEQECLGFLEVVSVVQLVFTVFKKKVSQAFFHVASVEFEEAPVVLLSVF